MKIFREIQKKLGLNDSEMARIVGLRDARAWISFRESVEKVSARPLLRLMEASPIPKTAILEKMKKELRIKT